MKKITMTILLSLFSLSAFSVECSGERRESIGRDVEVIKKVLLDQNYQNVTKLELDIKDAYFSAQIDGDDVLAIISLGPEYTNGNLFKGSFDSEGSLKLSYVTPTKTLILVCNR